MNRGSQHFTGSRDKNHLKERFYNEKTPLTKLKDIQDLEEKCL